MDDFSKLLQLLKEEAKFQERLLNVLTRERTAIVKLRQDELDAIQGEKEKILDGARSVGEKRAEVVSRVSPEKKMSAILALSMPEQIKRELKSAAEELRITSERVQELNTVNGQLLKQALGIVTSSIAIFRAAPGTELPVYSRKGALNSETEDPAFAKRGIVSREA